MPEIGFSRAVPGRISVELHPWMRNFVVESADGLTHISENTEDPAYSRICGPINVAVDYDDPLVVLERQMAIDSLSAVVHATSECAELTDDQAEAWLQVLSMMLAVAASRFAIVDEDYADSLDEAQRNTVGLIQALQWGLVDALETEIEA
jgi:hypothetical protein